MQTLMNHLCNLIHLMYYTTSNIANLAGNKLVLSFEEKRTLSLFITNATLNIVAETKYSWIQLAMKVERIEAYMTLRKAKR